MGDNTNHGWTDERVERLKKLWAEGLSAGQIAKRLNGVSRCGVIGKVHRLRLSETGGFNRAAPSAPLAARPRVAAAPKPKPERRMKIAGRGTVFEEAEAHPPRVVIPFSDEGPGLRSIMEIGFEECRWVCAPVDGVPTFCGAAATGSWCKAHAKRVFVPVPAGRPRTGNELARSLRRYA